MQELGVWLFYRGTADSFTILWVVRAREESALHIVVNGGFSFTLVRDDQDLVLLEALAPKKKSGMVKTR